MAVGQQNARIHGEGEWLACVERHNQSLQQMVTVVTVRAKHGPRQPRPLLKLVLERHKLECIVIPYSLCRSTHSIVRTLLIIALLTLAAGQSAFAIAEFLPSIQRNIHDFESYYEIRDLADAAREMRQDAAHLGLNINAHPEADKSRLPFAELHLPVTKISPDISDRSYVTALKGESRSPGNNENCVAILAVYRELSIDEVAKIFESGIQILQNLFAGPGQPVFGGFLVNGRAADLLELQKGDYFAWLGEYSADLKIQPDLGASSINQYSITLYKRRFEDSYFSDLESHQVVVLNKSERFRRVGVECDWETAKKLCELDWVQSLYPVEYAVPD